MRPGLVGLLLGSVSCGAPEMDCTTLKGKAAILDEVYAALSIEDCGRAIEAIEPAYQTASCAGNDVRMARAAAYGCLAGVNYFKLLGQIVETSVGGAGLWTLLAKLFPSTVGDTKVVAGQRATEALLAVQKRGAINEDSWVVGQGSAHPGSLKAQNREADANMFLVMTSMAQIGALQNRYSAPDPSNYSKTQVLGYTAAAPDGWAKAVNVNAEGCTYASSILNMLDSIHEVGNQLEGKRGEAFKLIGTAFGAVMNLACELGCQGAGGYATGCALPAGSCNPCPLELRNRNSCTAVVTEKASCAAAGIAHFINTDAILGWP